MSQSIFSFLSLLLMLQLPLGAYGQDLTLSGTITSEGQPLPYATITIPELGKSTTADEHGHYTISELPKGKYVVRASFVGLRAAEKEIQIVEGKKDYSLDLSLEVDQSFFDQVVVTGTKTFQRKTNSPVIVNVLTKQAMDNVQACNLSEGLKFQPGLRVETDCQTCNYTQLRMNGMAGGYSQILINGRPIFSPLTGLYGLEQLPANMIERIEVIRGGGSTLYGSSAIAGTVNVITRLPEKNTYELNYFYQNINGRANDHNITGNASVVSKKKNAGISFFINHREREMYDHNGDNFSEAPQIENSALGTNFFLLPSKNQKIELSLSHISEYRYGGEMVNKPAYLTQQSEERTHYVWMGSADYQLKFNDGKTSLISYLAWQNTQRDHYTGILPDEDEALQAHFENPPYGTSLTTTYQGGFQLDHELSQFLRGSNVLTLGGEYVVDDVFDEIDAYRYLVDQTSRDLGIFLQSDWKILPSLNLLSGIRMDRHNLVDRLIFSPRASLLYKLGSSTQFRLNYGTGFRAPQAFDADLHIAFAGGGVSRVVLSPDLHHESSESLSASVNYDKVATNYIAGFTLEAFHTRLRDAFYREPLGEDSFGEVFEKRNGPGASVQGFTLELRANYDQKAQLEAGFTLQESLYKEAVQIIDQAPSTREFMRTPNDYGFATLTFTPNQRFKTILNMVYTGRMKVPHLAGAPGQPTDEIITSPPFTELNIKAAYTFPIERLQSGIEIYGGIKNILNAYQDNFDTGKNRDSNFVYGPALPRMVYLGVKVRGMR